MPTWRLYFASGDNVRRTRRNTISILKGGTRGIYEWRICDSWKAGPCTPQGQFLQKTNIIASNGNNRMIYKFQWVQNLQSKGLLGLDLSKVCQL